MQSLQRNGKAFAKTVCTTARWKEQMTRKAKQADRIIGWHRERILRFWYRVFRWHDFQIEKLMVSDLGDAVQPDTEERRMPMQ